MHRKQNKFISVGNSRSRRSTTRFAGVGLRRAAHRRDARRGAAVVEFAVCLPVIMILILGSIEATNAVFLKQALTTSAYEGIREAIRSRGDQTLANARAREVLDARSVQNATVSFTPANFIDTPRGELISVEVAAPLSVNSPFIGRVISDRTITVRTTMVRE